MRVFLLLLLAVFSWARERDVAWQDTELTSQLWSVCSRHDTEELIALLSDQSIVPPAAFARSQDGRGPLFWAYEYGFEEGIQILEEIGVSAFEKDAQGKTPKDLGEENAEMNEHRKKYQHTSGNEFSPDHYGDEEEDYDDVLDDDEL